MGSESSPAAWIDPALRGDRAAVRALFAALAPVIQARAARVLSRSSAARGRDLREDLRDMTQEVFLSLLEDDGRVLRSWQRERGLSLENFVGLVAERQVVSIARSGRRSPWTEEPTEPIDLADRLGAEDRGDLVASREILAALLDRLRLELTPRMLHLFYALWVHETPVAQICEELGMQPEAVYTARSRISKRARAIARELSGSPSPLRIPVGGEP